MKTNKNILYLGIILLALLISFSIFYLSINRIDDNIFIKTYGEYEIYNFNNYISLYYITDKDNMESYADIIIHTDRHGDINTKANLSTVYDDNLYKIVHLYFLSDFINDYDYTKFNEINIIFKKDNREIFKKDVNIGEIAIINKMNEEYNNDENIELQYSDEAGYSFFTKELIHIDNIEEYINPQIADIKINNEKYIDIIGKEYKNENITIDINIKDEISIINLRKRIHYTNENGEKNFIDIKYNRYFDEIFDMNNKSIKDYLKKVGKI